MTSARFGPLPDRLAARCAPPELDKDTYTHLKGVAHGFFARLLGEVCGIAGAVTVLDDLVAFLRYMLDPAPAPAQTPHVAMPSSQSASRAGVFEQS